jgi:catechol-2,3-dioxygenase
MSNESAITDLGPKHSGLGAIRSLDYTILLCDDIAAMRRFYADVIGFAVHEELSGRWVSFRIGSSLLALRRRGRPGDGPSPATGAASVQLAFRVPPGEVAAAAAQLAERGVETLEPVTDQSFRHRTLFFADPEHNIVEIYAEI